MSIVNFTNINKRFGETQAVDNLSFEVMSGEIFGLLGPNGAGKTTSIRMILDIFEPDSGEISVLGGPMEEKKKNRIGYLPEERGLYQDIPLERCLTFLATLKGMEESQAKSTLKDYLERFDLYQHRDKKVKELSKGMQQKAQLITTLVHDPELVIIDEPFTALDPVNTEMVKDMLEMKRDEGKAIIMSTHQMNQVEELCDRILLINHGHRVLYGTLLEIQKQFASKDILVTPLSDFPNTIPGVANIKQLNGRYQLVLEESAEPNKILKSLINQGVELTEFEIAVPPLNEIFIQVVQRKEEGNNG
ncbi:MAG: ABC transporter ATP-binding protein [Brevefilum sp.]